MLKKLIIVLLIPFILCACSKNNKEEIVFSSWGSITETKITEKIISDFEKENPDIKINFMHVPQNYFQKLHLLFASNQAPDVIFINNLYLPVYANHLCDLTEFVQTKDFYPQSIEAMSYNGEILAIPRDISNFVFYRNKSLIPDNIQKEWNFEDFKKLINKYAGKNKYSFYPLSFERDIFMASPYVLTLGYDEGIKFYKNLEGKYAPTPAQVGSSTLAQMFLDGKIGLYLSGRWMYPKISETANFQFDIIPFCGNISADSSGWAISKTTKHKSASIKFVKYISSKNSIDYYTETGLIVPARIDSSKKLDNPKERAFLDTIKKSVYVDYGKNYNKERDKKNKELWK